MVNVTVHSLPGVCVACRSTEMQLKAKGIPFVKVVMDDVMIEKYKGQGLASAPVVVVEMDGEASWTWSGYRHDDIARLKVLFAESLAEAA